MNTIGGTLSEQAVTPADLKKKKQLEIWRDKSLNIWQKKLKWDELDKLYPNLPSASLPAMDALKLDSGSMILQPLSSAFGGGGGGNPQAGGTGNEPAPLLPPWPNPTPKPTSEPSPADVRPMPGPGPSSTPNPKPSPAAPVDPYSYEAQRQAIVDDSSLDSLEKKDKLYKLDIAFGKTSPAQNPFDAVNETKLKSISNQLSDLDVDISYMKRYGATQDQLKPYLGKVDTLKKQLGNEVQGLGKIGYGYGVDASNVVDIKLTNTNIGNARYKDGKITGNIDEAVKGFGGKIDWNGNHTKAVIKNSDGYLVTRLMVSGDRAYQISDNGSITDGYTIENGQVQVDISHLADQMGVPLSYYHDKNGAFHAYAQKDMRNAPVQAVRKEGEVYIDVNMDFQGKYTNTIFPGTEQKDASGNPIKGTGLTYAEVTAQGIMEKWGNGKTYNVGGQYLLKDSSGNPVINPQTGEKVYVYTDPNDTVKVHVNVYSNDDSKNGILQKPKNASQKMTKVNLIDKEGTMSSHVFTANNIFDIFNMLGNVNDAVKSGQLERVLNNWSMQDPGEIYLYPEATLDAQKATGAHETGHVFGLGDAYASLQYRLGLAAPEYVEGLNEYGQAMQNPVPKNDMMRTNEAASD